MTRAVGNDVAQNPPADQGQVSGQVEGESLAPDKRMRKVNRVRDGVGVRRVYRNKLVRFAQFECAANSNVSSRAALFSYPGSADQIHKRSRTSVQNGQLQVIQFDNRVIDAHP